MILAELNKLLLNVARSSYLVNDAFIGDVYTINGKENKFGCFVATPMSAVKESGTIRYTYYMYYIDRLTKDEANIDFVQSDAVSMLKGLLDYIEGHGVEIESGSEFTLFRQQFSDWCAGAYVNVSILVADNDCQEGGFNAGGYSLIDLTATQNGIYTPPSGYDGYGRIVVNVPQVGATEEWVDEEIDLKLTGYATEDWVRSQHYLTQHQDISGKADKSYVDSAITTAISAIGIDNYATRAWVTGQDYLQECDLEGYATQAWTNSQGFLKECDLDGYATKNWVLDQGYITESWASQNYASKNWVNNILTDYATSEWVNNNFIDTTEIQDYAQKSWVENNYVDNTTIQDYAQKDWVSQNYIDTTEIQDYATTQWVENNYVTNQDLEQDITDLGFATEQWVEDKHYLTSVDIAGKLDSDLIWSGTQAEWDALTQEEQCSYLIAMITE